MENRVIFWDFDGTLTQHQSLWSKCLLQAIAQVVPMHRLTAEDIRSVMDAAYTWNLPHEDHTDKIGEAWWSYTEAKFCEVYEKLGIAPHAAREASRKVRGLILRRENYVLYSDAVDTLMACRALGYKNYILSNNFPDLEEVMNALGLMPHLDGAVVSACVGYDKPRAELFAYAKHVAGDPDGCYMVGDNPISDIAGGNAAGMVTILVHEKKECRAAHFCNNLSDIPLLLAH